MCMLLALMLAACSDAALFGWFKHKSQGNVVVVKHTLVIFPFDKDAESAESVPDEYGETIAGYLRTAMSSSKGYSTLLYDARLMPIKRAVGDNVIKEQDTKGPFVTDKPKAMKLADLLAIDYYIVGSIEGYTYDKEKKTVEITLKADLVAADSGKLVQEFLVAATAGDGNQADDEEELRTLAAGKAVQALKEKILATSPADVKAQTVEQPKEQTEE